MPIPVVDLFAGPGGLSEGFEGHRSKGRQIFHSVLAIEKDEHAHRTLLLRTFFRQFAPAPNEYYAYLRGELSSEELFKKYPRQHHVASSIAIKLTLSRRNSQRVRKLVRDAVPRNTKRWVLLGGPPCQAYSVVGRSRMNAKRSRTFQKDRRHFLYQEYLRILHTCKPPVFVMENVKGLLSSAPKGIEIFQRMLSDFHSAGYNVHSFVHNSDRELKPSDYIIKAEQFGIPQTRHRVLLLGVRKDVCPDKRVLRPAKKEVPARAAIQDLPRIRSQVSPPSADSPDVWLRELRRLKTPFRRDGHLKHMSQSRAVLDSLKTGGAYIASSYPSTAPSSWLRKHNKWFIDRRIRGVTLHQARHHMPSDLRRYLFASHYAHIHGASPRLRDFPRWQRPDHENLKVLKDAPFSDRFRVQLRHKPATTVVAHISKDGHYYIHYDPTQCRSLTVREAARLQTFPDNYFFEGPRTAQYHQVGNAVPPLLAKQLARIVHAILQQV